MIAPRLDITASPSGYRVAFVADQRFEVLGEFVTLDEAHAAYRAALSLTETARSGKNQKAA